MFSVACGSHTHFFAAATPAEAKVGWRRHAGECSGLQQGNHMQVPVTLSLNDALLLLPLLLLLLPSSAVDTSVVGGGHQRGMDQMCEAHHPRHPLAVV